MECNRGKINPKPRPAVKRKSQKWEETIWMQVFPSEVLPSPSGGKEKDRTKGLGPFWVLCSVYDASWSFLHTPQSSAIRNSSSRGKNKGFQDHMKTLTPSGERLGLKLSWKVPSRRAGLSKGSLGTSALGRVEVFCFQV